MTTELPKISNNLFLKGSAYSPVDPASLSFKGAFASASSGLSNALNYIRQSTAYKNDTPLSSSTFGLNGANTPDIGCGKKIWTYC